MNSLIFKTFKYQCSKCGDYDTYRDLDNKNLPTVCYGCAIDAKADSVDMNAVEEYIQNDHGYVISSHS